MQSTMIHLVAENISTMFPYIFIMAKLNIRSNTLRTKTSLWIKCKKMLSQKHGDFKPSFILQIFLSDIISLMPYSRSNQSFFTVHTRCYSIIIFWPIRTLQGMQARSGVPPLFNSQTSAAVSLYFLHVWCLIHVISDHGAISGQEDGMKESLSSFSMHATAWI